MSGFHRTFATGWHANRGRLLLRTPGPVPLGLAYVLLVETNPFPNLSLFYLTMLFEYPSVLSRFCFIRQLCCTFFKKRVFFVSVDCQYALFKSTCSKTSYLTPCNVPHEGFLISHRALKAD